MKDTFLAQLTIPGGDSIEDPTGFSDVTLETIIGYALTVFIVIGAVFALVYLIIGGFRWISSGGDAEQLAKARSTIIFALIGLGTIIIAGFVMNFIGDLLGIPFFELSGGTGGSAGRGTLR